MSGAGDVKEQGPKRPIITLVVAADEAGVIGARGGLPWRQPADLKHFKAVTLGHPIVMGRKTWESIGRPLPGRENVVVTRQSGWAADGVRPAASLDEALSALAAEGHAEVMVIGGGEIFREALPRASRVHFTRIHTRVAAGDTYFPELDAREWREISARDQAADEKNAHAMRFSLFERR